MHLLPQTVQKCNYITNVGTILGILSLISGILVSLPAFCAVPNYFPFRDAELRLKNNADSNTRIIGGTNATWSANPWQVAIVNAKDTNTARAQFCGASVVNLQWVVTAAHCVDAGVRSEQIEVFGLSDNLQSGGRRFAVVDIHVHPNWNRVTGENDIALLKVKVSNGQSIGIAIPFNSERNIPVKTPILITGWGITETRPNGTVNLQQTTVPYVHALTCMKPFMYGGSINITINMFCAGGTGHDTCSGDSGGPATAIMSGQRALVGITSTGGSCGALNKPGIYTKMANYIEWARKTMKLD